METNSSIPYYILGISGMVVFCSDVKYKADCVEGGLQKNKKVWEGMRYVPHKIHWQSLGFHQGLSLGLFGMVV